MTPRRVVFWLLVVMVVGQIVAMLMRSGPVALTWIVPAVAVGVACGRLLRRNDDVAAYRRSLVDRVAAAARRDVHAGAAYEWRWDRLDSVTHDEMLWKFWKPLGSFYPDEATFAPPLPREELH